MADQLSETRTDAEIIWECIYDHGNGKYKGEKSAAQRAEALAALERLAAPPRSTCAEGPHMTTTPAMPEHSVAIKHLTMAANQFDCAAATTNDHKKAADYLQESREIRASIATLQAQPAAAGVSDAASALFEVWRRTEFAQRDGEFAHPDLSKYAADYQQARAEVAKQARAILALRPQAVPMTDEQVLHDFERECADTDKLLSMLGMNPDDVRTDGGSLNLPRIASLLGKTEVK